MTTQKKFHRVLASLGISLVFGLFNPSAAEMNTPAPVTQMVVTILPAGVPVGDVKPGDLQVYQGTSRREVTGIERLSGERAGMELFIYLDRSLDSAGLDAILPQLAQFIQTLPETTRVAVGDSIGNQTFTADRERSIAALMQPLRNSGAAGTWSNLLDLIRQWPAHDQADRRAVLIVTAGVSPEYAGSTTNDPYVEATWRNAQIAGIGMYSILIPGGNAGQSSLSTLSNATGGRLYAAADGSHCSLRPFLDDVTLQLENQYRITFEPKSRAGAQAVKIETDSADRRVISPSGIYIRRNLTAATGESASAGE
jgi:hypothetical protein